MIESPGLLLTVASFLVLIGPLIFLHELGHYFAGRIFGVHAEAFSIGFGRELFGWSDKRGTRWKVAALPLGGYVKFAGDMSPASEPTAEWLALPPAERARTFQGKKLWQKAIIVAAGPIANFLVAIAIFSGFLIAFGEPRTPNRVAVVAPGSPAEAAGVRPGDRITMIARQGIYRFEDIVDVVAHRPGETMLMDVYRGEQQIHMRITPALELQRDRFGNEYRIGRIGVAPVERVQVPLSLAEVPGAAVRQTVTLTRTMADTIWQIISGRRSVTELGGPIRIAKFSGQIATLGWKDFVWFMAVISINLGFMNLLPVPMLDGGHLMFYAVEAVRRRPVTPRMQDLAYRSGLALVLGFMVFVTINDLGSFGLWKRLGSLIG